MASASTPVDRIFKDLQECIFCIQQEFKENAIPITDDNTLLHRFCAKLEYLLQYGQKEKTNLLGTRKDYWDFFCACLRSHRAACEGLRFVKSKSEIKTSLGRGRGFIRFCLVHKCLADTLQHCFSNINLTKEWYHEASIWRMPEKWPDLISSMYELSDVNFALSPEGIDLDVDWPTFARKVFDVQYSWQPPSRSISISSLISQTELSTGPSMMSDQEEECDKDELKLDLAQSQSEIIELSAKLQMFQQREAEMKQKIDQLEKELQQCESLKPPAVELQVEKPVIDFENKFFECKLSESENIIAVLKSELEQKETSIESMKSSVHHLEGQNADLTEQLLKTSQERDATVLKLGEMSEKVQDFQGRLEASEKDMAVVMSGDNELLAKLDKMQKANDDMKQLVIAVENKNRLFLEQSTSMKEVSQNYESALKNANEKKDKLNRQMSEVSSSLQDFSHQIDVKEIELETARRKITELEEKVNSYVAASPDYKITELINKISNLESVIVNLQNEKSHLLSKCEAAMEDKENIEPDLSSIRDDLEAQLLEKSRQLTEANSKLSLLQNNTEKIVPFLEKQELLIDNLKVEMSKILMGAQKLSQDMSDLVPLVHNVTRKEGKDMDSGLDSPFLVNGTSLQDSFDAHFEPLPAFSVASETSNVLLGELDILFFPVVRTIHRMIAKLRGFMKKQNGMEHVVSVCQNTTCQIFHALNDYERKVITVSSLERAHHAVKELNKEHKKLQAAEAILRYELREKRKLLSRLRQQLEVTREEWNRVKIRNQYSRNEWCNLRDEFARRYKQPSEESGFVDGTAEPSEVSTVVAEAVESVTLEGEETDKLPINSEELTATLPTCEGAEGVTESSTEADGGLPQRTRLEIMEEECQLLYSSLVHSSHRSDFLMQRLNLLLSPSDSTDSSKDGSPFPTGIVDTGDVTIPPDDIPFSPVSEICNDEDKDMNFQSAVESLDTQCLSDDLFLSSSPHSTDSNELQENGEIEEIKESRQETEREDCAAGANLRKRALEALVRRCKSERSEMEGREAELKERLQLLESENSDLKSKVKTLIHEKHAASKKDSEFRKRAEFLFRHERDTSDVRVHSLSKEKTSLEKELKEIQEQLCKRTEYVSSLEKDLEHARESLKECQESFEQEVASLRFQISTEALKYERALQNYVEQKSGISVMDDKLNNQEQLIQSLEMALTEIQDDRQLEQERQFQEFEELQFMLTARDEECITLNEEAKKAVKDLDDTKNALSQLHVQSKEQETKLKRTIRKLETELSQWKNDNEELKKQIIKLTRDKDSLWKKTEKLSHLQQLQTADRWMDDSEAINCLLCKTTFSFTLRKHHCRLCGRIFCHDCTNNWLLIASSSRKVRVCTECYRQQMDLYGKEGGSDDEEESVRTGAVAIATNTAPVIDGKSSSLPVAHPQKSTRTNIVSSLPIIRMWRMSSPSNPSTPEAGEDSENEECITENGKSNDPPKMEFDVITDEEIARSLSACSPYTPHHSPSDSAQSRMQMSSTRSADEIEKAGAAGVKGEMWVNAGTTYGMPVLIDQPGHVLSWEFTSEPKSIVFSVSYREAGEAEDNENWDTLLARTRVQSHLFPIQGHLVAKRSGVYLLVFNNYFSRFMAKKVSYVLKVNNKNSVSCSSIEETLYEE